MKKLNINIKKWIKMRIRIFRQDKLLWYSALAAFFIVVASFVILFFKLGSLPSEVPLFYSLPWGEEQLAKPINLLLLPFLSLFFFSLNLFWAGVFCEQEIFLARILSVANIFLGFLAFYTLVRIIFLLG